MAQLTHDIRARTVAHVSEREPRVCLDCDPFPNAGEHTDCLHVGDIERELRKLLGGDWIGFHRPGPDEPGSPVPGVALWAQRRRSELGRWVLTGLLILGDAITAEQLRRVPVAGLENAANLSADSAYTKMREELDRLPPLRRAEGMTPEGFSRLVAEHYKVWARYVPHPAAAMAAEWQVKPSTMHTWIREARLRGLLPPAKRGKAR